jgi:hypothetical protein
MTGEEFYVPFYMLEMTGCPKYRLCYRISFCYIHLYMKSNGQVDHCVLYIRQLNAELTSVKLYK